MDEPRRDQQAAGAPNKEATEGHSRALASAAAPLEGEAAWPGGGLRLLAAAVTAPWLAGYGVTGAWAVTRAARAAAGGLTSVDVGYTRLVSPSSVIVVGALLLAAFAVVLATAILVLCDYRGRGAWVAVFAVAAVLAAGSVWAAARGGLHPGLWLLFFAGLLYVTVLSLVALLRMTRAAGRGTIAGP